MPIPDPVFIGLILAAWTGLLHVAMALLLRFLWLVPAESSVARIVGDIVTILAAPSVWLVAQEMLRAQRWNSDDFGPFSLPLGGEWAPFLANLGMTLVTTVLFALRAPWLLAVLIAAGSGALAARVMFVPPLRLM